MNSQDDDGAGCAPGCGGPADAREARKEKTFGVTFPDDAFETLRIRIRTSQGISADQLEVERVRRFKRSVASFITQNAGKDLHVPTRSRIQCPHCGSSARRSNPSATAHIIGPEKLDKEQAARLKAEVRAKVRRPYYQDGYAYGSSGAQGATYLQLHQEPGCSSAGVAAPFLVSRRGIVASVSAAVMEEAAAKCPALRTCLWGDVADPGTPDGAPTGALQETEPEVEANRGGTQDENQ